MTNLVTLKSSFKIEHPTLTLLVSPIPKKTVQQVAALQTRHESSLNVMTGVQTFELHI